MRLFDQASAAAIALAAMLASHAALAAPVGEAAADAAADGMVAAWTSMDSARIKALYAPGIVGFDPMVAPLSSDRATWDKLQDGFAAAKIDKGVQQSRTIQLLDADTFVVSGVWDISSTAIPANAFTIRCTDVFEKTGAQWLIVNEHCSQAPK